MIITVIFAIKICKNTCDLIGKQLKQNNYNGTQGPTNNKMLSGIFPILQWVSLI